MDCNPVNERHLTSIIVIYFEFTAADLSVAVSNYAYLLTSLVTSPFFNVVVYLCIRTCIGVIRCTEK